MNASESMRAYFAWIQNKTKEQHSIATQARKKGYDPADEVEVSLAANMAERVVGLISVLAPQLVDSGVVERIIELEKEYNVLDWRVALKIAEEIAQQKFCTFETQKEAIEIGIRTGFAYVTVGVVSSPLDGLINITYKQRLDGKGEYFCLNFAGPIRNAGGTAASVCVIIADYVRNQLGYQPYDATEEEAKRAYVEVIDYIERCAPRQHTPVEPEILFLMKHMPVEVNGDPSERFEVSNYKDLPRIPTNIIRSGFCLVMSDCIPLKAPKLWKQLNNWGEEFNMSHWNFLEEFIAIQKKGKAQGGKKQETGKLTPNYSYVKDIVAGRPVLGYPLEHGSFRLRYGRSRFSGYSAISMHPATMAILQEYIATGTQLRTERPGKAASMTACDTIEGPIVKLRTGDVIHVHTLSQARQLKDIEEILYLGDALIAYGDFFNRAATIVPAGYCEEWWAQEVEQAIVNKFGTLDLERVADFTQVPLKTLKTITEQPTLRIPVTHAWLLTQHLGVPLHPQATPFWTAINTPQLALLCSWMSKARTYQEQEITTKIVLQAQDNEHKRVIELLGIPHTVAADHSLVLQQPYAHALEQVLKNAVINEEKSVLENIQENAPFTVRDKAGIFIGSRMGRPEKAKQRKMTGSPHMCFPVGDEGGRLRSIQSCMEKQKITSDFQDHYCPTCNHHSVFRTCEQCKGRTTQHYFCRICNAWQPEKTCEKHGPNRTYARRSISIAPIMRHVLSHIGMRNYPDLIKGVRGTSNKNHTAEHLAKGILRAKHNIYTFKDGTTRYDMTELPMTHFKPKEIGTSIEQLQELGYEKDIYGKTLHSDEQILEIKPQDVVLPRGIHSGEEGCDTVLLRVAQYCNDLLEQLYKLKPYFKTKDPHDLVGELVICLAPHTSAGMIGRIIGFSSTQGFWAHPYIHAATRRDCDGDESCVMLLMDAFLNFSKEYLPQSRGGTMDAPLVLTSILTPAEVDDMAFDLDIVWRYPLELYEAAQEYKKPWDVSLKMINNTLGTPEQFEGMGFTHDTTDMNETVQCSAYKTIPSMQDKLKGQMELAEKIRAVNSTQVATLVIEKHFLKDSAGNLRKFTQQTFRCVTCNAKYRRVPLIGKCTTCGGKIIFTVSKGNIMKYMEPTQSLAKKYNVSPYLQQSIELLQRRMEGIFGREKEQQTGLGAWFG
ncbi:DNA polymerase II large subunit [Candidatus Woesearchaeota archaeon]|nr:DNA polymerase II large subunit [Candidatus Woesearchaeota archaeon]